MSAADFYTGMVIDVYSVLRSTTFDADRYLEFVRRAGEPALELGCGDDGPFLELVRRDIDVEGIDSSPDMIDRCRAKAQQEGLSVVAHCQPMEEMALPRSYRSIYLAGPTFNLLPDDDHALRALRRIAAHLQPGGEVMVPLWIPPATGGHEFGRTREAATANGGTARSTIESEDYDAAARTRRTLLRYELEENGRTETVRRDWIIHWHTPEGFALLAGDAGLRVVRSEPLRDDQFTVYLGRV